MSTTESLTLQTLVEDTLEKLYRTGERPRVVVMGATALADAGATTFTINDGTMLAVTDVVEWDQELVLITAKTADATPVFTCTRGYSNTTAGAYVTNQVGLKNPQWGRMQIQRAVGRYFDRAGNLWLPNITSAELSPTTDKYYVSLPEATMRVLEVRYVHPTSGRIIYIDNWTYHQDLPAGVAGATSKALRTPASIDETDSLIITTQEAYVFTDGGATPDPEDDTIGVPIGSQDLPSSYACAYLLAGRELSRSEVDHVEEWNQDQAQRAGVNLRLLRDLWGQFYRGVDEARRLQHVPRHRPYRKRTNV